MQRDKQKIAHSFGRAATRYDDAAALQQWIGDQLLAQWEMHHPPLFTDSTDTIDTADSAHRKMHILDAGAGTGYLAYHLRGPKRIVTAFDLSAAMLSQAKANESADLYKQGDMESMPFEAGHFHSVVSNLAIQWCADFSRAIGEMIRVTKVGGRILFTTVIAGSLRELDHAWQAVDHYRHTLPFLAQSTIEQSLENLRHLGFNYRLIPLERVLTFPSLIAVMRSLQSIGATAIDRSSQRGLMGRERLQRLERAYPKNREGQYPLTYQLLMGVIER